jgi:hypothetical protein
MVCLSFLVYGKIHAGAASMFITLFKASDNCADNCAGLSAFLSFKKACQQVRFLSTGFNCFPDNRQTVFGIATALFLYL